MLHTRRGLSLVLACSAFFAAGIVRGQINTAPEVENVFRPADREFRQALSRAEKAIEAGEFADAVEEIGRLLQDGSEDYFVSATGRDETRTSLKAEAERLLMKMPQRGRDLYETKYGAEARAMLDKSIEDNSLTGLNNVTRSYFQTKAGMEAAILLGRLQLDQGRPLAAALTFRRVLAVPGAKAAYDPELSLLLAVAWQQAQRPDDARQTLANLKAGGAPVMVNAKPLKWFAAGEDPLEWLAKLAGGPAGGDAKQQDQWCLFRGNETRNAIGKGGLPLADFRWRVRTVDNPSDELDVRALARKAADQNLPAIPALQPLAIGDSILMRTNERLVSVDFETGKIVWEFPWFESEQQKTQRSVSGAGGAKNTANLRQHELQQKMWEDAAYGQVSSDGESAFLLNDLRPASLPTNRQFIPVAGRMIPNPGLPSTVNQLVALDLKKQGKLRWVVGGASGEDEPRLAQVFFLGAPLPVQDQLLVLGERRDGEVHLFTIDAATGKLDWSQQIANMNEMTVNVDVIRRLAGVSPSFSDGLAICPTSGGAVVAVDWAKRSLAWGYAYRRTQIDPLNQPRNLGVFAPRGGALPQTGARWADSAAIIADGAVVLTPTDSNELHCLDLLTGKTLWPPQERKGVLENMLYVACVHDGKIYLVGKSGMVALNLKDGKPVWTKPLAYDGGLPSGRGVFTGSIYYLPLSTSEILAINLAEGMIVERVKTALPFGNLVSHKDDLISLGADALTTFYLREPLKKRVEDLLAKNPQDPWALARKGEILLQEGKRAEAIVQLRAAQKQLPNDPGIRTTLVKILLTTLREDYAAAAALAPEIEGLIDQPAQKAEFLRLTADGLAKAKAIPAAFDAYISLALLTAAPNTERSAALDELERNWRVKSDRWLTSRLAALYREADESVRQTLDQKIVARLGDKETERRAELVKLFAFHPAAYEPRLKVAADLQAGGQLLAAENELWPLSTAAAADVRGRSWAILADVLLKAERPAEAALVLKRLQQDYADVALADGKTGREIYTAAREQANVKRYLEGVAWPGGKVNVATDAQRDPRFLSYQRLMPIPLASHQGLETFGQQVTYDQSRSTLVIRDGLGRVVSEATLKADQGRIYFQPTMSAVSFGHLLVVSMGGEVIAIDTLRRNDAVLWRQDTNDRGLNPYPGYGMQSRQIRNPLTQPRQVLMDQNGKPLLASIAVGPWGVVFQRGRGLVCLNATTGEPIWERTGFDGVVDLFADDSRLFVAPVSPGFEKVDAVVLDPWDGSSLDKCKVAAAERRWATCGRNVLSFSEAGAEIKLQLADPLADKELWSAALPIGSRGALINGEEAAVLQPSGKLTIVSLKDGKTKLEADLEAEKNLMSLFVLRSTERYFILPSHPSTESNPTTNFHPAPAGANTQLFTGRVYAFDRQSGKQAWASPAYVSQHGYVLEQPADLPVLLFLRHATPAKGSGAKTFTSVLCLDKRNGQAVLDANEFPTPIHAYEVSADREKARMQVTVFGSSQRTYTLQFTDEPAPPAAPAQLGPASSLRTGPPGTGVNVAGEVLDRLNGRKPANPGVDPFGDPVAPPPPKPAPPNEDPFK